MKGKIAVILVNDPDYENADEQGLFKGRRMTWYGRWPYKYAEAARHGAKAALIVHDTFPAAYGWNVLESSGGTGNFVASANKGFDQTEANGWIRRPVAEAIFQAAGKDLPHCPPRPSRRASTPCRWAPRPACRSTTR
jgi:hypothetical protein